MIARTYSTALLILVTATSVAVAQQPKRMTWKVDGLERHGLVYAPTVQTASGKAPVVLAFHGHGGVMGGFAINAHFHTAWPEAIVVYLQGLPIASAVDPQGLKPGWDSEADALTKKTNRDVDLVDTVLATLRRDYHVDDTRIYAAGFSNGAIFSLLLWAARGLTFAAIGADAGVIRDWKPPIARPVIYIAGEKDPLVTPERQRTAVAAIREFDHATGAGESCGAGCTLYPSSSGTPVRSMTHDGAHVYPPFATEAMVAFFKAHPLVKRAGADTR